MIAIASQIPLLGFAGLMLAAAISDIRAPRIPNRVSLAAVLLYPVHVLWAPAPIDWTGALAIATAALALGFALFNFRIVGGGDAKLFAAAALWAGPELVIPFALSTAVAGGVLAARDLPAGSFVKENDLSWQAWPEASIAGSYFIKDEVAAENLYGAVVRRGLNLGEPVIATGVVRPGDHGFLTAVLEPGYRAVATSVNAVSIP